MRRVQRVQANSGKGKKPFSHRAHKRNNRWQSHPAYVKMKMQGAVAAAPRIGRNRFTVCRRRLSIKNNRDLCDWGGYFLSSFFISLHILYTKDATATHSDKISKIDNSLTSSPEVRQTAPQTDLKAYYYYCRNLSRKLLQFIFRPIPANTGTGWFLWQNSMAVFCRPRATTGRPYNTNV